MKKFVDRFQELETLENEYNSNSSSFVVLYSRRRRIGKTEYTSCITALMLN